MWQGKLHTRTGPSVCGGVFISTKPTWMWPWGEPKSIPGIWDPHGGFLCLKCHVGSGGKSGCAICINLSHTLCAWERRVNVRKTLNHCWSIAAVKPLSSICKVVIIVANYRYYMLLLYGDWHQSIQWTIILLVDAIEFADWICQWLMRAPIILVFAAFWTNVWFSSSEPTCWTPNPR